MDIITYSKVSKVDKKVEDINDILKLGNTGTKNIFDPSNPNQVALIPVYGGTTVATSGGAKSVWVKVQPNSTVTLNKEDGNRCQALSFTAIPENGSTYVQNITSPDGNTGTSVSITVGATDVYVMFYLATSSGSVDFTKIKIFYGTIWNDGTPNAIETIDNVLEISEPGSVNLFDKNHPNQVSIVPTSDNTKVVSSSGTTSIWLKVNPNSTVTLDTKSDGNRCQAVTLESQPASNVAVVHSAISPDGNTGTSVTITTGATDIYVLFYLATSTSSCTLTNLRVYYGTSWHNYTPNAIEKINARFYNALPETNAFNLMSYRPLGPLSKPYIAISCDDGAADLATTTIPLFKGYKTTYSVNIPLTMGLMKTSAVLNDNSYLALVNEMLTDYGCEVATHGWTSYTEYTNSALIEFMNEQETFINTKCGRKPIGVIYPNHAYDLQKKTIAGSYYGVCAAGYSQWGNYSQCNGARSNMYELHRWSLFVSSQTTATIETVVDYCYDHNLLLMPWFHDNALTGDNAENNISLLDHLVAYGRTKGIDFISFKDIPSIK